MDELLDKTYRFLRFFTDKIIGYLAASVMLGATVLALVEIFRRYLLGMVWHWSQDAVTYFMVSSIVLFFSVTQARRSHLAVTAALDWLRSKGHLQAVLWIRTINTILALLFCSGLAWWGIPTAARTLAMGRTTQSMLLPVAPFQYALIVGFTLMALVLAFQLYQDIQALRGKKVFPWASTEEGLEI
jgi:TRAP-type C4-dicarboxylate transport system permease small subunit